MVKGSNMKNQRWLRVCMVLLLLSSMALISGAAPSTAQDSRPMRKIVIFGPEIANEAAREALLKRFGGVIIKQLPLVDGLAVTLPPQAAAALLQHAGIVRIDDDLEVYALDNGVSLAGKPAPTSPPPPPAQVLPWGVDRIDAELAWATTRGAGVKVAVIDTGIALSHTDLRVKGGVNTINPRKSYADDNGHGTHVAGTIAALDNSIGVVGVAPLAELYAVKVLNKQGIGFLSDIIEGLQWSIDNGMQVVNMSLGGGGNATYEQAIRATYQAGLVIVAAAGNDGPAENTVSYPAKYAETIAVSATDISDTIASFSSRGPEVDLAAPGVNIYSTWYTGGYRSGSGTSMATPHVAGAAALLIAAGVTSNDSVRAILQSTAEDLGSSGWDSNYGYGLVDAKAAIAGS